jgi:hypothetical protein
MTHARAKYMKILSQTFVVPRVATVRLVDTPAHLDTAFAPRPALAARLPKSRMQLCSESELAWMAAITRSGARISLHGHPGRRPAVLMLPRPRWRAQPFGDFRPGEHASAPGERYDWRSPPNPSPAHETDASGGSRGRRRSYPDPPQGSDLRSVNPGRPSERQLL